MLRVSNFGCTAQTVSNFLKHNVKCIQETPVSEYARNYNRVRYFRGRVSNFDQSELRSDIIMLSRY